MARVSPHLSFFSARRSRRGSSCRNGHTLEGGRLAALDAAHALAELGLGGVELLDRAAEVVELFLQLLLDLGQLLDAQRVDADCRVWEGILVSARARARSPSPRRKGLWGTDDSLCCSPPPPPPWLDMMRTGAIRDSGEGARSIRLTQTRRWEMRRGWWFVRATASRGGFVGLYVMYVSMYRNCEQFAVFQLEAAVLMVDGSWAKGGGGDNKWSGRKRELAWVTTTEAF